ncbi:MAG TPA: hypothetical protein VFI93_00415 [Rhizomicrobium sp.]|jgi:hypothetical protein|nr:hypothetical protein [Rhizomicrobium sp.]
MLYFIAIFCSPLALLLAGKPFQAIANLLLYILSIAFWVTIIFHSVGFVLWALGLIHAIASIDNARANRRNRALMAEMRQNGRN